ATFPLFLHYCQDARMYPLALLFEVLALAGWLMAEQRPRTGWFLFTFSLVCALYTHNHCLVFAGMLIGGVLIRLCLAGRCSWIPASRQKPVWIISAAVVIGILYLPWIPVLRQQMDSGGIELYFHAPTWRHAARQIFLDAYTLTDAPQAPVLFWLPGLILLLAIPLAELRGELYERILKNPANSLESISVNMVLWVSAVSLLFLILYSMIHHPV